MQLLDQQKSNRSWSSIFSLKVAGSGVGVKFWGRSGVGVKIIQTPMSSATITLPMLLVNVLPETLL